MIACQAQLTPLRLTARRFDVSDADAEAAGFDLLPSEDALILSGMESLRGVGDSTVEVPSRFGLGLLRPERVPPVEVRERFFFWMRWERCKRVCDDSDMADRWNSLVATIVGRFRGRFAPSSHAIGPSCKLSSATRARQSKSQAVCAEI